MYSTHIVARIEACCHVYDRNACECSVLHACTVTHTEEERGVRKLAVAFMGVSIPPQGCTEMNTKLDIRQYSEKACLWGTLHNKFVNWTLLVAWKKYSAMILDFLRNGSYSLSSLMKRMPGVLLMHNLVRIFNQCGYANEPHAAQLVSGQPPLMSTQKKFLLGDSPMKKEKRTYILCFSLKLQQAHTFDYHLKLCILCWLPPRMMHITDDQQRTLSLMVYVPLSFTPFRVSWIHFLNTSQKRVALCSATCSMYSVFYYFSRTQAATEKAYYIGFPKISWSENFTWRAINRNLILALWYLS